MKNISIIAVFAATLFLFSCGDKSQKQTDTKVEEVSQSAPASNETSSESASSGLRNTKEDSRDVKGVGKFTEVTLSDLDPAKAKKGEEVFTQNCSACHKMDKRFVGPALGGVTKRRSPEWILNMISNPELMVKEDPIAQALLKEYLAPMANQNIDDANAMLILEYFRSFDSK